MEHHGHLTRIIKLAQRTGDRFVVSLDAESEPVVILSLSAFERMSASNTKKNTRDTKSATSLSPSPVSAQSDGGDTPRVPQAGNTDPADAWDSEYDAERIFAQFTAGNLEKHTGPLLPDRMRTSLSEASDALHALESPVQLQGEERFSLGAG